MLNEFLLGPSNDSMREVQLDLIQLAIQQNIFTLEKEKEPHEENGPKNAMLNNHHQKERKTSAKNCTIYIIEL